MYVDEDTCPKDLQGKARSTIRELNLNAPRLMRMRREVIHTLEDQISDELSKGRELDEVLEMLATICLVPDYNGVTLPFFSVIRWYLGEAAEEVIRAVLSCSVQILSAMQAGFFCWMKNNIKWFLNNEILLNTL